MDIKYSITLIRDEGHSINIPSEFVLDTHGDQLELSIEFEFEGRKDSDELTVVVVHRIFWNKNDSDNEDEWIEVFSLTVRNKYDVENLGSFINERKKSFAESLIIKFSHLSASHARGIQSMYTNNTPLQSVYISTKRINAQEQIQQPY